MANMFALPGLNNWTNAAGGWSNSSGGPSNGAWPGSGDVAIFDANSGASRSITVAGNQAVGGITTVGAAVMTFIGTGQIRCFGAANFTGTVSIANLFSYGTSFIFGGATVGAFVLYSGGTAITNIDDSLTVTGTFTVDGGSYNGHDLTFRNGAGLTIANFSWPSLMDINLGTGTFNISGQIGMVDNGNFISNLATIKFVGSGSAALNLTSTAAGTIHCATLWNAMTGGSLLLSIGVNPTLNVTTFKAGGGTTTKISIGKILSASNWDVHGMGSMLTISSGAAGSTANVTKVGGGTVEFGYANVKDLVASPVSTFRARNSVDLGNNSNIFFFPRRNNFLAFM